MNSESFEWLGEIDAAIVRMLRGVVWFIGHWLPNRICELIREIRIIAIRLTRIVVLGCLWLLIVAGPMVAWWKIDLPTWLGAICIVWTALAITGSVWGLQSLAKDLVAPRWCKRLALAGTRLAMVGSTWARQRMARTPKAGAV